MKSVALAAVAASMLLIGLPTPQADARPGGGSGGRGVSMGSMGGHGMRMGVVGRSGGVNIRNNIRVGSVGRSGRNVHRGHWRGSVFYGVPTYGFYDSGHYDGGGCYWLKRRAINTGSRYWWRRYRDCRGW